MGLMDNCGENTMKCFSEVSRVNVDESTWCSETLEVSNKWLDKGSSYHENAERLFQELGVNVDYCLDSVRVEGMDEVRRLEQEEMAKEVMAAEGITADEEDKPPKTDAASACTGVTNASTTGTVANAMAAMNARQTVVDEQQKRAAAQQATSILRGKIENLQQAQLQMFMVNWNNNGLSSVTNATPVTAG